MEETIVFVSDNMRRWKGPKPGMTKFGTHLGRIIVTDQRLMFLSSGGSKLGSQITMGLIAGPLLGNLILGKSLTKDLDLSALSNEGSLDVKMEEIDSIEARRRWDFASILSITFTKNGNQESYAFMKDPFGMGLKAMQTIVGEVEKIKKISA